MIPRAHANLLTVWSTGYRFEGRSLQLEGDRQNSAAGELQ